MPASFPPELIQNFRDAFAAGERRDRIAERFGVARSTVYRHTIDVGIYPPTHTPEPPEVRRWEDRAACRGHAAPDLFHPEAWTPTELIGEARRYCRACPVKAECLASGIAKKEWGIWGDVLLEAGCPVEPKRRKRTAA